MNRLILIGNGFDLAHGMRTSYGDFIFWYLKKVLNDVRQNNFYTDNLITVKNSAPSDFQRLIRIPEIDITNIGDCLLLMKQIDLNQFREIYGTAVIDNQASKYNQIVYFLDETNIQVKCSVFLEKLLNRYNDYKWVDIEKEYYTMLLVGLDDYLRTPLSGKDRMKFNLFNILREFHSEFKYLITQLEEYLTQLAPPQINQEIFKIIKTPNVDKEARRMFVNFNYTKIPDLYINQISDEQRGYFETMNIHGELNNLKNPIIFGFGDEADENYPKLENLDMNIFLDYAKSFGYFKTSNYTKLTSYIDLKEFEIYVMGHSCGLSDRTMLKMIFEHTNCKSIKIFYYEKGDWNNHFELTQEISRHFSNKDSMRRKIVPFENSRPLPQYND